MGRSTHTAAQNGYAMRVRSTTTAGDGDDADDDDHDENNDDVCDAL